MTINAIKGQSDEKIKVLLANHLRHWENTAWWHQGTSDHSLWIKPIAAVVAARVSNLSARVLNCSIPIEASTPWPMSALKLLNAFPAGWPGWGRCIKTGGYSCCPKTWSHSSIIWCLLDWIFLILVLHRHVFSLIWFPGALPMCNDLTPIPSAQHCLPILAGSPRHVHFMVLGSSPAPRTILGFARWNRF